MTQEVEIVLGSDNVFADLGLPNAEEMLVKAKLAHHFSTLITKQGLTQEEAALLLGVDQPKVSALIRGKLTGFSLERLLQFLNALGQDVEIVVKSKPIENTPARTIVIS